MKLHRRRSASVMPQLRIAACLSCSRVCAASHSTQACSVIVFDLFRVISASGSLVQSEISRAWVCAGAAGREAGGGGRAQLPPDGAAAGGAGVLQPGDGAGRGGARHGPQQRRLRLGPQGPRLPQHPAQRWVVLMHIFRCAMRANPPRLIIQPLKAYAQDVLSMHRELGISKGSLPWLTQLTP